MLLVSKRSALTPYSSLFSHTASFFPEQKHRFFIFWWIRCLFSMNQTFFLFLRHRNWSFYIKSFHSASNQVHAISDQAKSKLCVNSSFSYVNYLCSFYFWSGLFLPKKISWSCALCKNVSLLYCISCHSRSGLFIPQHRLKLYSMQKCQSSLLHFMSLSIKFIHPSTSAEAVLYVKMPVFSIAFHFTLDQVYSSPKIS